MTPGCVSIPPRRGALRLLVLATALTVSAAFPLSAQNKVEPLSNGLQLHWTKSRILQQFGEPTKKTWNDDTFGYPDLDLRVGGRDKTIWSITLTSPDVRLASGIGVGSTAADFQRVFGGRSDIRYDQYQLAISYDRSIVTAIRIAPVNGEFRPVAVRASDKATGGVTDPSTGPLNAKAVIGRWYGANASGQWAGANAGRSLQLMADGRYLYGTGGSGRWVIQGDSLRFSGTLAAWNHGVAGLSHGNLEFAWTNADGGKQYFVFIRKK